MTDQTRAAERDRSEEINRLREALEHYANASNWGVTRREDGSLRIEFLTVNEPPWERAWAALDYEERAES